MEALEIGRDGDLQETSNSYPDLQEESISHPVPSLASEKEVQQKSRGAFLCPVDGCSQSYSRRFNLQRHMKSVHGDDHVASTAAGRFVCHIESCAETFYHASRLTQHYKMKHNIHINTETKQFCSWEAFLVGRRLKRSHVLYSQKVQ
jgi:uncharacterized Zn-finger protein